MGLCFLLGELIDHPDQADDAEVLRARNSVRLVEAYLGKPAPPTLLEQFAWEELGGTPVTNRDCYEIAERLRSTGRPYPDAPPALEDPTIISTLGYAA